MLDEWAGLSFKNLIHLYVFDLLAEQVYVQGPQNGVSFILYIKHAIMFTHIKLNTLL